MRIYQNKDTKEILNLRQMREQWREKYDGDDDTNVLSWNEQYEEFETPNTNWIDSETGEVLTLPEALDLWEKYYKKPYPVDSDDEEFFRQFVTEDEWKITDSKKVKDDEEGAPEYKDELVKKTIDELKRIFAKTNFIVEIDPPKDERALFSIRYYHQDDDDIGDDYGNVYYFSQLFEDFASSPYYQYVIDAYENFPDKYFLRFPDDYYKYTYKLDEKGEEISDDAYNLWKYLTTDFENFYNSDPRFEEYDDWEFKVLKK